MNVVKVKKKKIHCVTRQNGTLMFKHDDDDDAEKNMF